MPAPRSLVDSIKALSRLSFPGPDQTRRTDRDRTLADDTTWGEMLDRLNRLSVDRHFDAYQDVPWDDPAYAIDPTDTRWEPAARQPARRHRVVPGAAARDPGRDRPVRRGRQDEGRAAVRERAQAGLLEFALDLPDRVPEFRYAYHEVIEEAQHSLMFQEFVNRSGLRSAACGPWTSRPPGYIVKLGRRFPAAVSSSSCWAARTLIDHVQRQVLSSGRDLHPLAERIMRIHRHRGGTPPGLRPQATCGGRRPGLLAPAAGAGCRCRSPSA